MALFGDKKEKKNKEPKKVVSVKSQEDKPKEKKETNIGALGVLPERVLIKPHISEKALLAGERNVYVFKISPRATKRDVSRAIEESYGVKPTKVCIAKLPGKRASRRLAGRPGKKKDIKKAYVYLKEGDKLSLV